MKPTVLSAVLSLVLCPRVPATTRVDLNRDWLFRTDAKQSGEVLGWQKQLPGETEAIEVPHTWNLGKNGDYLGRAWYFRTFERPPLAAGGQVELHFGATFYSARVWLNGMALGRHEGGYTAYGFDITANLREINYLAVEIDNRPGVATIPGIAMRGSEARWYDFWAYGGIVRDVWLTLGGTVQLQRQQIRTRLGEKNATVEDQLFLENHLQRSQNVSLRMTAFDPDNQPAANESRSFALAPGASEQVVSLTLAAPKLWDLDHPNVYRMAVELTDSKGKVLDRQSDTFGIRKIEIRDRHLFLNGERVRLTGLTRHEDSPSEGLAETAGTMRFDYDDMKALHVTLTRPVHYPQNPFILDYADRHGILLIPEIPLWQFSEAQLSDPQVLALARQQMKEMIEQAGNHPSIFAWSVCNESATSTPGGVAYVRAMRDFIHTLDPDRFVSYADDRLPNLQRREDSAASEADFVLMNQYFGSWHGRAVDLPAALDKVDRMFPEKMVIISEFGFAGVLAKDSVEADRMRRKIIREQLPELARRDWIAGAIFWCYQDYRSRRNLWPGQEEGYVDHGLVDEYRQRRPSYLAWKEATAPAAIGADWNRPARELPTAFAATVTPNPIESLPSFPLHDYRLAWEVRDENGKMVAKGEKQFADLAAAQTVSVGVEVNAETRALMLQLTLLGPSGWAAAEKTVEWRRAVAGEQPIDRGASQPHP